MDSSLEPQTRDARPDGRPLWRPASRLGAIRALMLAVAALLAAPLAVDTQGLDICGCASIPGLLPFDSRDQSTWPTGSTITNTTVNIKVPEDGILRFSSFFAQNHLTFIRNQANTPVTILVAGNVTFNSVTGCCWNVVLSGQEGSGGNSSVAGVGGQGGPAGYRGGDGANKVINTFNIAGSGFGPGGGAGGAPGTCAGTGGQFFGSPELLPLLGGSGGGGGCSSGVTSTNCSGGGGGGGGGALLIAANGTLTINNFQFFADGGGGGSTSNGTCAGSGAGGSGGAIRLVAAKMVQQSAANLHARAGSASASAGRIRLETLDTSAQTVFGADPPALRHVGPTPLANPVSPTVKITNVGGSAVPTVPVGVFGDIDIVVPIPGATNIDVETSGIPGGTTVLVTVKPRLGAPPISETVPLTTCDSAGSCQATTVIDLAAGTYVVEARATFQTQ